MADDSRMRYNCHQQTSPHERLLFASIAPIKRQPPPTESVHFAQTARSFCSSSVPNLNSLATRGAK
eukprot:scaffold9439_cov115-Cylindrotheca_fusiformis.AAC.7